MARQLPLPGPARRSPRPWLSACFSSTASWQEPATAHFAGSGRSRNAGNCAARRCTPTPSSSARAISALSSNSAPAARHRLQYAPSASGRKCIGLQRMAAQLHAAHAALQNEFKRPQERPVILARRFGSDQIAVGLLECSDHGTIGRWHWIARELGRRYPGQRLTFTTGRGTFPCANPAHVQHDALVAIGARHRDQRLAAADMDAEFFMQLARERLFGSLAGVDLAARKLPQSRQVATRRTAREQDAPTRIGNHAGDYMHGFGCAHRESGTDHSGIAARRRWKSSAVTACDDYGSLCRTHAICPWHCLYFLPEPQGQRSLRPIFAPSRTTGCGIAAAACAAST